MSTKRKAPAKIAHPVVRQSAKKPLKPQINESETAVSVAEVSKVDRAGGAEAIIEISSDAESSEYDLSDHEPDHTNNDTAPEDTKPATLRPRAVSAEKPSDDTNTDIPMTDSNMPNDAESDQELAQPTLGELARAHGTIDVPSALTPQSNAVVAQGRSLAPPSHSSLGTVLSQALRTDDTDLLESCLRVTDSNTIDNTIQRLDSTLASILLTKLASRMHRRPGRAGSLMTWVQSTLICHGGRVSRTARACKEVRRAAAHLMNAQLKLRRQQWNSEADDDVQVDEGIVYVEGEDSDADMANGLMDLDDDELPVTNGIIDDDSEDDDLQSDVSEQEEELDVEEDIDEDEVNHEDIESEEEDSEAEGGPEPPSKRSKPSRGRTPRRNTNLIEMSPPTELSIGQRRLKAATLTEESLKDSSKNDVSLRTAPSQQRKSDPASSFFQTPSSKRQAISNNVTPIVNGASGTSKPKPGVKRSFDEGPGRSSPDHNADGDDDSGTAAKLEDAPPVPQSPVAKKVRTKTSRVAPLAERMRPDNLDEVFGQELVGPNGVLRSLIETNRVPSIILWGASGTGKTTIARCVANQAGSRFIEMNATSSGVAECKKLFSDAANELALTGRKTIIFCDEIHRFSKTQQDVFLKPVEAGTITLIGATTENPSFKVVNALLSRCRTFTLQKLTTEDIQRILARALQSELPSASSTPSSPLDEEFLAYLANFADGDARTALNLLELAISLANRGEVTKEDMKASLTKTLVYDRAGDQHYDTISAFHKSVRGSDPDATLYYLARMLQSGEDPLFIARRMVVVASEDVGLADNSMLTLATSTFTATQQIGMPEARIP
ncbi:hypothetical protein CIB48_g10272, partial [Xylaria polymorpha]